MAASSRWRPVGALYAATLLIAKAGAVVQRKMLDVWQKFAAERAWEWGPVLPVLLQRLTGWCGTPVAARLAPADGPLTVNACAVWHPAARCGSMCARCH